MALPTASDNPFPSILAVETAAASISTPAAGKQRLFVDTDHVLKYKNSAGVVSDVGAGGGGVSSLAKFGGTAITGAVTLSEGSGVTLTEVGQDIAIAATGGGPKIYRNKPAGNITRAATTVGAFSTAWQITGVVVASGQNVKLEAYISFTRSASANDVLFALFRDSTQIAAVNYSGNSPIPNGPTVIGWIDENPGAGTYTYEVRAAQFTSGTLTVYQTNITTDVSGGTSILIAEVYTP